MEWQSKRGSEIALAAGYSEAQLKGPPRRKEMFDLVGSLAEAVETLFDRIKKLEAISEAREKRDAGLLFRSASGEIVRRTIKTSRNAAGELLAEVVETSADDPLAGIRARIDALEKGGIRFRGIYQRASTYRRGDQATHRGSLWTALLDAPEGTVPGDAPAYWQLSAKGTG